VIFLKDSIDRILAIDRNTRDLVDETNNKIEKMHRDLRDKLSEMENDSIEQSKILGKKKEDEIDEKFKQKVQVIKEENKSHLEKIEKFYKDNEDELVRSAFNMILEGKYNA